MYFGRVVLKNTTLFLFKRTNADDNKETRVKYDGELS